MYPEEDMPPERLWHYTSGSGAKGIFLTRTLWAGHLGYMNDTSEVGHALKVSREVADQLMQELPDYAAPLARWTRYVKDIGPNPAPNIFAVSFSEERDLLSQWRGYANGPGGPFCIGFPSGMLERRVVTDTGRPWTLRKCLYVREEQAALIAAKIRRGLDLATQMTVLPKDMDREEYAWHQIFGAVFGVAPLCKHPDFAEEREWRLLFGPTGVRQVPSVHFIERCHTLAPYIEFPLTDDNAALDGIEWVAGPGPQQDRANTVLGMVAQLASIKRYTGAPSHTPYMP